MNATKYLTYFLLAFFILGVYEFAHAQDTIIRFKKPIVPNYLNLQYAGNIGAYIIGAGYNMNRKKTFEVVVSYGFSLPHHSAKRVHNIAIRGVFILKKWDLHNGWYLFPQTGLGISRQLPEGSNTFTRLPKTFPEGYYAPNAFRAHFNLGGKIRKEMNSNFFIKAIDFYAETTTNDQYVMYFLKSKEVGLNDIFSLALGINLLFYNH